MKNRILLLFFVLLCASELSAQKDSLPAANTDSAILENPEIHAGYPGGTIGWFSYLQKHLIYPDEAMGNNVQGTVEVQFLVDADGNTFGFKVLSGPKELRNAALDVVKKSGKWIPATQNGKKVKSYLTVPLKYKLQ